MDPWPSLVLGFFKSFSKHGSWDHSSHPHSTNHCFKYRSIYQYIGRYTGILFKRYDKCKNLSDIVFDRLSRVANISADIRDEISDISTDIVTYLDNYYYFLLERLFYFILCSLWYCNDVFIWCLDNNLFLLIMSYMYWHWYINRCLVPYRDISPGIQYPVYNFADRYIADIRYLKHCNQQMQVTINPSTLQ